MARKAGESLANSVPGPGGGTFLEGRPEGAGAYTRSYKKVGCKVYYKININDTKGQLQKCFPILMDRPGVTI